MAPIATSDLVQVPFPDDVPTINLQRISLAKLMEQDEEEGARLFDICTHEGFMQLDLTTHPVGLQMVQESSKLHDLCADIFNNVSFAEKSKFKTEDTAGGNLDTGYKCSHVDAAGDPDRAEMVNISAKGLFQKRDEYELPAWLAQGEALYKSFIKNGNIVANEILALLEKQLQLEDGALTSLHKITDPSGDFLRLFRYPAPKDGKPRDMPTTPAHTDATSVTILFNWEGGLQITNAYDSSRTTALDHENEGEESWLYVKPLAGHAIVNLGDAMVVFTNGVTKSGKHRVVTPPGPQGLHHRYSCLVTARPHEKTMMSSFASPVIPAENRQLDGQGAVNAHEWAWRKVRGILDRMEREKKGVTVGPS